MVLVLLIGGWLGWIARSARVQREAVAAIQKAGGEVSYHETEDGSSRCPGWLASRVGIDYRDHVTIVMLISTLWTDAEMSHVGRLSSLLALALNCPAVTDEGLVHLKGLTNLRRLQLSGCHVGDRGLKNLRGLTALIDVDLSKTLVTDAGIVHLQGLKNLQRIDLRWTRVTDVGLAQLKALPNLRFVLLDGTQVTDAGVRELLQSLPSLRNTR
jgi:hypothetical protein